MGGDLPRPGRGAGVGELYTDRDLLYSATARCWCGAGLAYPSGHNVGAWKCARSLRGEVPEHEHDSYARIFYKIREETSIRNAGGATTRPSGTVCRTVGAATCPQCQHKWESEPYSACGRSHHWYPGRCPNCGYGVGGQESWSSEEGPAIVVRYRDVVLDEPRERSTEAGKGGGGDPRYPG